MRPSVEASGPAALSIQDLRARLESSTAARLDARIPTVPIGIRPVDAELPRGGLQIGRVHEWLGVDWPHATPEPRRREWLPAFTCVLPIVGRALALKRPGRTRCVWIGSAAWAYPIAAAGLSGVPLNRCLCVCARSAGDRLWAADLAMRCPTVAAVIVDGSGFDLAATRRLQLAAEAGAGFGILMRPPWDARELSAAATRWIVGVEPASSLAQRWRLELRTCKGTGPLISGPRIWCLERDHATRCLRVVSDIRDRSGEAQTLEPRRAG